MVPFCVKDVFTAENSEHGGKIHNSHVLSAWVQQNGGGRGIKRQRKWKAKGTKGKCQVHTEVKV